MTRMPSIFVSHGSPKLIEDATWVSELAYWARSLPRPRAILLVSAHWVEDAVTLGATQTVPLIYDYNNFPPSFYQLQYPAPGAPDLAARVRELVVQSGRPVRDAPTRGLDHGAFIPLMVMYPNADIPVLEVSLPSLDPAELVELGRVLAPLRDEGILLLSSGALTHNLRMPYGAGKPVSDWAIEIDAWFDETLRTRDVDALVHFKERAPHVAVAHPTDEHFVPVLVALGSSVDVDERTRFTVSGLLGCYSKRSVQFG